MTVSLALLAVVAGLVVLGAGGEALIRGAVSVARVARLSTAVIGLTIVAMGTSMPELSVSLLAAMGGRSDIAMGNVVGSNIFNLGFILGGGCRPLGVIDRCPQRLVPTAREMRVRSTGCVFDPEEGGR